MKNHYEHELLAGANPDVTPIDDDDLDDVAGGLSKKREAAIEESKAKAIAAGHYYQLPSQNRVGCLCNHQHKYALTYREIQGTAHYSSLKCFQCGKTRGLWSHAIGARGNPVYVGPK